MTGENERIVVYPDRVRLIKYMLLYLLVIGLMGFCDIVVLNPVLPPYTLTHPGTTVPGALFSVVISVLVLLCAIFLGALLLFTLYRVMVRKPSIVVTEDGILDDCSLIVGGMGLLRWNEINAIMPVTYRKGTAFVLVFPYNARAIQARRGPLARLFLRGLHVFQPQAISMPEWLLSISVDDFCERIKNAYPAPIKANGVSVFRAPE